MFDVRQSYERKLDEQARNYDGRIKTYIDTIEQRNKKEQSLAGQVGKLKQDCDLKDKEIQNLRQTVNQRKIEIEKKDSQIMQANSELMELKTQGQLI